MTRAIGIDIGSRSIKIAEVEIERNVRNVVGLTQIPFSDASQISGHLKDFFSSAQSPGGERVAVGLGSSPILIRHFQYPFGDRHKVTAAIQADFEDSLPFDLTEHVLDFKLIGRKGRIHEFVAGLCPLSDVMRMQSYFEGARSSPHSLLVDCEAMGQLALDQCLPASRNPLPYALCDLGFSSTKLSIVQGARPQTFDKKAKADAFGAEILEMRVLGRGSRDVMEWLADMRKISLSEAEQWLAHRAEIKSEGSNEPSLSDELSDEIKNALKPVVVEIYQTLQAFRSHQGRNISTLYITGGMTKIKGLRDFLSQELRMPVNAWPLLVGFHTQNIPVSPEQEREFAVALALAHRYASPKPQGWLNFKRNSAGNRKVLSQFVTELRDPILRPALLGLSVAALCTYIYFFSTSFFLNQQGARLETELVSEFRRLNRDLSKTAERFVKDPVRAREFFEKEKAKLAKANSRSTRERARSDILIDLSLSLPTELVVKELSIEEAAQALLVTSRVELKSPPKAKWQEELNTLLKNKGYSDLTWTKISQGRFQMKAKWKGDQNL